MKEFLIYKYNSFFFSFQKEKEKFYKLGNHFKLEWHKGKIM